MSEAETPTWTPERLRELRRLRSEGVRAPEIARKLGISVLAVGAQSTRMKLCDRNLPIPEVEAILDLAREGATASRIARRHRIDEAAVLAVLARNGVEARSLPSSYRGDDRRRASR